MLHPEDPDRPETFDIEAELAANRPPVTQPGDLILLGPSRAESSIQHRLLCGDCTSVEDVRRVMDGDRAVLFATDPPYLVDYDGTNHPGSSRAVERRKNKDWSDTYGITWDEANANDDLYEKFIDVAVGEAILSEAAWYCLQDSC